MNRKSNTPPCPRGSKSPIANGFKAASRNNLFCFKQDHLRKANSSASRSASRLNNKSETGESKSYRRQTKDFTKEYSSRGRKKESHPNAEVAILMVQC